MPKMFGFSRRRMKLGRLKLHLGDPLHGTKSPMRQAKPLNQSNEDNEVLESASGHSNDHSCQCSSGAFDLSKWSLPSSEEWTPLPIEGNKPAPRSNHAAAIVGSKMVVVGGDSGNQLLNDTMILNLDRLTWAAAAASRVYFVPNGTALKIPACKGHSLVPWGKTLFLVGGKTEPATDRLSVWVFDVETEFWSQIEAKGDIPVARSGHSVTRAGAVLILFGGENAKGRKLNDLHMLDLKSLTWLPLQYKGTKPSPRSNHVATLYDDRLLFVFGGQSKSRILNDLYSLDFERMVWSRVKDQGHRPSPRAGCRGALCGAKWYITGGGSKTKRHAETLIFDILNLKWTVFVSSPITSVTTNRGFSLLPVHQKDKMFLVAFGGYKREPSNQVEVLFCTKNERSASWRSAPDTDLLPYEDYALSTKELSSHLKSAASPTSTDPVSRHSLAAVIQQHSGRKSISDDPNSTSNIPLPKQSHHEIDHSLAAKMQKTVKDENRKDGDDVLIPNSSSLQTIDMGSKRQEGPLRMDIAGILATTEEIPLESQSSDALQKEANDHNLDSDHALQVEADGRTVHATPNAYQLYETRISSLIRKIVSLEEQLKNASASKEAAEKNLSSATRSRQDTEKKLADTVKEVELLKEKLEGMELVQEEANTLSNIALSDNLRLEHDVAFLKAILDDTQKELHSTHGVLAAERARAFQLQVELFQLKQRLQPVENRARSPRKPFHM